MQTCSGGFPKWEEASEPYLTAWSRRRARLCATLQRLRESTELCPWHPRQQSTLTTDPSATHRTMAKKAAAAPAPKKAKKSAAKK